MRAKQLMVILGVIVPTAGSAEMALTDMYVGGFGGAVFGVDAKGKNDTTLAGP